MVDIEHGALRALEEHAFAVVERLVQHDGGVDHEVANALGNFEILIEQPFGFERMSVSGAADGVFLGEHALKLFAEAICIEQVADANAAPRHFVFVGRSDAARSGADFRRAPSGFGGFVHFAMIGKNQVRAVAQEQASAQHRCQTS